MRILFALFLLSILIAGTSNAQTLTADEMIAKTNCNSFACFNEFVDKRGFSFSKCDSSTDTNQYIFLSDILFYNEAKTIKVTNVTSILIPDDNSYTNVGFRTIVKSCYLKLLADFKSKGFSLNSTEKGRTENEMKMKYTSVKYKNIYLVVSISEQEKYGIRYPSYDFEVLRMK